jgi:hypothetical protein
MIEAITILSKEYQEVYPKADGISVGGMRHYKTPCKHLMAEQTFKDIANKTVPGFTLEDGERKAYKIQVVDIKKVEKPKPKAKDKK